MKNSWRVVLTVAGLAGFVYVMFLSGVGNVAVQPASKVYLVLSVDNSGGGVPVSWRTTNTTTPCVFYLGSVSDPDAILGPDSPLYHVDIKHGELILRVAGSPVVIGNVQQQRFQQSSVNLLFSPPEEKQRTVLVYVQLPLREQPSCDPWRDGWDILEKHLKSKNVVDASRQEIPK